MRITALWSLQGLNLRLPDSYHYSFHYQSTDIFDCLWSGLYLNHIEILQVKQNIINTKIFGLVFPFQLGLLLFFIST